MNVGPGQGVQICAGGDGTGGLGYRLAPPDAPARAAAPPAPEVVAATLLARVAAQMHAPEVVADPPVGTASVVSLPVFVQVTNWAGTIADSDCVLGVCVEITAVPTLTFDSGEPGTSAVECAPPGTRFDPAGPDPVVQASAAGACAHVYTMRSGAAGRPGEWPGQVIVTWDVSWAATGAAEAAGTFPPQSLSTPVPRAVNEVQTVVVG
ncbi:MAG TPA: hypothetical protein VK306_10770 [Acidimicrobiales bacterium]|nr:hypothetical protein [Acidimicrobiales bacterium]